eukprot:1141607-Pelagomonas_calceolata.AAC.3
MVSEGSYGSNLLQMDVGSADRLAQHDLQCTSLSNSLIVQCLPTPLTPAVLIKLEQLQAP